VGPVHSAPAHVGMLLGQALRDHVNSRWAEVGPELHALGVPSVSERSGCGMRMLCSWRGSTTMWVFGGMWHTPLPGARSSRPCGS
jgi:hypothetical protein